MPRRHPPNGLAAADDRAEHVDGEDALDALDGQLVHPRLRAGDPGVRDERGEGPHRLGRREGTEDVGLDRNVGPHGARNAACALDLGHD